MTMTAIIYIQAKFPLLTHVFSTFVKLKNTKVDIVKLKYFSWDEFQYFQSITTYLFLGEIINSFDTQQETGKLFSWNHLKLYN